MTEQSDMSGKLFEALISRVTRPGKLGTWRSALPYLKAHAAEHAVDAGRLDDLLADSEFLVYAEPANLASQLHHARSDEARRAASIHRASYARHWDLPPEVRRQILAVDAARFDDKEWAQRLLAGTSWRISWATGGQTSPALAGTFTSALVVATDPTIPQAVACAVIGDRTTAIAGASDGSLQVWDLATSQLTRKLAGHKEAISAVATGTYQGLPVAVTASGDGTALVWDLANFRPFDVDFRADDELKAVTLTAIDGKDVVIAGGYDEVATVWALADGEKLLTYRGHESVVTGVCTAMLGGEPVAVTASHDGTARVWSLRSGETKATYDGYVGYPAGDERKWIEGIAPVLLEGLPACASVGNDGRAHVWDLATGTQLAIYEGHRELPGSEGVRLTAVACAEVGGRPTVITADNDGTAHVWDPVTTETLAILVGHTEEITSVFCTELYGGPMAVTASSDGSVRLWDLGVALQYGTAPGAASHTRKVRAVTLAGTAGEAVAVSVGDDKTARIWDLATGAALDRLAGHTGAVTAVAVAESDTDPVVVTASADRTALAWPIAADWRAGEPTSLGGERRDQVTAVASVRLPTGAMAVIAGKDRAEVWDPATGTQWGWGSTLHSRPVNAMAAADVGGEGVVVTVSDDPPARIWDPATGRAVRSLAGGSGKVLAVACTVVAGKPVGVIGDSEGTVFVHDLSKEESAEILTSHEEPVRAVACAGTGRGTVVFSASGFTMRVSDLASRETLGSFEFPYEVSALCARSSGEIVVASGHELVCMAWSDQDREAVAPSDNEEAS
jgi:WD40 repeat protein